MFIFCNKVLWHVERYKNDEYLKLFGENLKRLRSEKNLTQEMLSYKADTPLSQIGRIERGERAPTILTILILSKALGVHPKEMLDFEFAFDGKA